MKLFENKVGRPSNETLKKRKRFYIGVVTSVFLIILLTILSLSSLSTVKLTGAAQNFTKKEKINIPTKTKIYISKTSKFSLVNASGVYYIQDIYVKKDRVKISRKEKGISLGWVNASDIEKITTSTPNPTILSNYQKGDVNRNGKITKDDATLVTKYVAGLRTLNNEQLYLADMNGDNKVTSSDVRLILQKIEDEKSILVDFSKTATILGRTSYHRVTLKTSGDTFEVKTSKPKIVGIDETSETSFTLRAVDSGTSVITVTSKKTGETVTFNYTVPAYELPSTDRFGANEGKLVSKGKKNGIAVYAENTCNSTVVNNYITDINALKGYATKTVKAIYIVSPETMKIAYGSTAFSGKAIATSGYDVGYGVIDINCKQYDDYKIFHETAHAMDFRYKTYYGKLASEEFEELRLKYNPGPNKTPQYLRALSYNNYAEFFADAYAMYLGKKTWKTHDEINNKVDEKINEIIEIGW